MFSALSHNCKLLITLLQMCILISASAIKAHLIAQISFFNEWMIWCQRDFWDFFPLSRKPLSAGTVCIVVFSVLFISISSIFENAATLCGWFCFLLRNQTLAGSPALIFSPTTNCVKRTYSFCIDKVWLQHQKILALFCFLFIFISKLTKTHRNQIKWLPSSHAVNSSFLVGSQEDTCGSQPSSVTSRPHCLPSALCNEFSLNIKLQCWQCSKSSLGSHICCNLNFPEEFLIMVSIALPIDHAHRRRAQ